MQGAPDMSGYGSGYGDAGVAGYQDPNAVAGYGAATGEARFVCSILAMFWMMFGGGVTGPLAAQGGGQICRPFVLGF